jgi:hypothetical protein
MFDGVEMNIVSAAFEIAVIPNGVFPKALLPKSIFTPMVTWDRNARRNNASRKGSLDPPPPTGKIRIAGRQRHDRMQVIRQNDHCIKGERLGAARLAKCCAQQGHMVYQYR